MRRKTIKFLILLVLGTGYSSAAYAITLEECKGLALKNSSLLSAHENRIKASIAAYDKDKSALWPQLSATSELDYLQYERSADLPNGFDGRVGGVFNVDLQKIVSQYPRLSRLEVEKNRLVKEIAQYDLAKTVAQAYYRLYILLKKKTDYVESTSYFEKHIQEIEGLQSRGLDVKLDLTRAQVQLRAYYISLSNINNEIANVLIDLNSQMKTDLNEADFSSMDAPDLAALATDQNIFDKSIPLKLTGSSIDCVKNSCADKIVNSKQFKIEELDLTAAREIYRQSKYYFIPSLQMGVDHNIHPIDHSVEAYRSYAAFTFNIFDFGQKANETKQQKYNYEFQKNTFEENTRKLKVQIDQLTNDVENAQVIYKNADENLLSARENRETAKIYYEQGKIKESDLLNIFSECLNARDQAYESLSNFLSKKAELDFLIQGIKL